MVRLPSASGVCVSGGTELTYPQRVHSYSNFHHAIVAAAGDDHYVAQRLAERRVRRIVHLHVHVTAHDEADGRTRVVAVPPFSGARCGGRRDATCHAAHQSPHEVARATSRVLDERKRCARFRLETLSRGVQSLNALDGKQPHI